MGYAFSHDGTAYTPKGTLPQGTDATAYNAALERAELAHIATTPDRLFLYVNEREGTVTTWPGTVVGRIVALGTHQGTWHGSYRQSARVVIHGVTYHGYITSAGDYIRLRKGKR